MLDHFFVLTEPGAPLAERLKATGLKEGPPNVHRGQGTSNRRFFFSNAMLEFLWVHDREEADADPVCRLCFSERVTQTEASPFGLVFRHREDSKLEMPFAGWRYEPEYLDPPCYLHIGANSDNLREPLLVFMPFVVTGPKFDAAESNGRISRIRVTSPVKKPSTELTMASKTHELTLQYGPHHLLEVYCEGDELQPFDARPHLPLVLYR